LDYWIEAVTEAFEAAGIAATDEQVEAVAADMRISHEGYGICFYQPRSEDPRDAEIVRLKRALDDERRKVVCQTCGGSGRIVGYGGTMMSNSQCWKCNGEGRRLP
jgi:hypothetical protein